MKKGYIYKYAILRTSVLALLCMVLFCTGSWAQSHEAKKKRNYAEEFFTRMYYGFGVRAYTMGGTYFVDNGENETTHKFEKSNLKAIMPELQVYLGEYFPLRDIKKDTFTIGLCPNLSFGAGKNKFNYSGSFELSLYARAQYMFAINTRKAFNFSGIGAGIGYDLNGIYSEFDVNTFLYASPSAILDISAKYKMHNYTLRLSANIIPYQYYYSSYTGDIPGAKLQSFAIHFLLN